MPSMIHLQSPALHRVLSAVKAAPAGLSKPQISEATGMSYAYVHNVLTFARRNDMLDFVQVGRVGIWMQCADAARLRVVYDTKRNRQKREAQRARNLRRIEAGFVRNGKGLGRDLTDEPAQRWASLSEPLPFRCKAPASVFHLGAML